ncbi:MAG: enoyl-CoA hydratase/isomerase family protein, partial [Actinomycetota bacterium]|nr:enoyl-CoA hydratase/isomerase family protein [Actinomycetota bacterium]
MLRIEQDDGVAVVRMEHGRVNAMDLELLVGLRHAFADLEGQPVVLTGSGSCFSAGVDLRRIVEDGPAYTGQFLGALSAVFLAAFGHPHPVVAAINGHALAGGCVLALAADYRLMAGGTIGLTELRVGVPFPSAAVEVVRYAVGPAAGRLALTADTPDGETAERLGLVHERCPPEDLLARATARAR